MMTVGMIIGLITLLGGGLFWAVRMGKKMEKLDQFEEGREKLGSVSEFNRKLDEETDAKIHSGDGPVSGPWLR
jgi:hypothetical protein